MYPVGMNEHDYLFRRPFDLEIYNDVAKIASMGGKDANDTFNYTSP
jgi:hypothetical protein